MNEQLLVKKILEQAQSYDWSLQGFGMLRLYLDDNIRIAVWDDRYSVTGVTDIHNHPWDFESLVISGTICNRRFFPTGNQYARYTRQRILCGEGAHTEGEPESVALIPDEWETYYAGETYSQKWDEIHQSKPTPGTVTLITKLGKGDYADVFIPYGKEWVDAEPRPATATEVYEITRKALWAWDA